MMCKFKTLGRCPKPRFFFKKKKQKTLTLELDVFLTPFVLTGFEAELSHSILKFFAPLFSKKSGWGVGQRPTVLSLPYEKIM